MKQTSTATSNHDRLSRRFANWARRSLAVLVRLFLSFALLLNLIAPAHATMENTATVTGTPRAGTLPSPIQATEVVTLVADAPAISLTKAATFANPGDDANSDGLADAGDIITYTYTVTNTGNVTLSDVTVSDVHDGAGAAPTITVPTVVTADNGSALAGQIGDSTDDAADSDWDTLGPADVITFTATYTVVQADLNAGGGGTGTGLSGNPEPDGFLDNTATVQATYDDGGGAATFSDTDTANQELFINASVNVTKTADNDTNVAAGTLVTYTYVVTNDGNVPVTNITLSDTHKGVPGALTPAFQSFTTNTGSANSGNTITVLQPGDVAEYEATYTILQTDVDNLQ